MSRSAHDQSTHKLHKLPSCSRCKAEFNLVTVTYANTREMRYEWECRKCHKVVPRSALREEDLTPDNAWLAQWCKEEEKKERYGRKTVTEEPSL